MKKKKYMKLKYEIHDDGCHRRSDCGSCPACPAYCMPMIPPVLPTAIPGIPDLTGLTALTGLLAARKKRDAAHFQFGSQSSYGVNTSAETWQSPSPLIQREQLLFQKYMNETLPIGNVSSSLSDPLFDPSVDDKSTVEHHNNHDILLKTESSNLMKRMGVFPFRRRAAECLPSLLQRYPQQSQEPEEEQGDDSGSLISGILGGEADDEDGVSKRRKRSLGRQSNNSLIKRRSLDSLSHHNQVNDSLKMRRLERSLLLGPRIQFFDHEGWPFFGKTFEFVNNIT
jgi:hypothetical protein